MPERIVKEVFGFDTLRPLQKEAISAVLSGRDAVIVMPTGGGKSLCYQVPAIMNNGLGIIVSPLIALMEDQVSRLRKHGIPSAYWNSTISQKAVQNLMQELSSGVIKLLYIAPERLASPQFLSLIKDIPLSLIAIDEAHCISEWGHDFRPDYRNLSATKTLFPGVPRIALTASATEQVTKDIAQNLELNNPLYLRGSFDRPNLFYDVRPKADAYGQILSYLKKEKRGAGIIYCSSRKKTEDIADRLNSDGFKALPYHAGLPDKKRAFNQEQFSSDSIQIIVATIAFGMGIDKANIRFIIHHDVPKSLEAYYQETGRAGRDGAPSDCILFYSFGDRYTVEHFLNSIENIEERNRGFKKWQDMVSFASKYTCRRKILLGYFNEKYPKLTCDSCDICGKKEAGIDATEIAYKVLSTVVRTKQRYGMRLIIDVLRGARVEKVLTLGFDSLSVFGIAKQSSESYLKSVIQALITNGYLSVSGGEYPTLQLTLLADNALRAREKIVLSISA